MSSLYDIDQRYLAALDAATDPDSDLDPALFADTLAGLEGEAEDKIRNVLRYARNLEAEADAISEEITAMKMRLDTKRNKVKSLRKSAMDGMLTIGKKKLEWPEFVASVTPSPESVVVDDEAAVPDDYARYTRSLDKTVIKQALKDGHKVPGCHLASGVHLRIR